MGAVSRIIGIALSGLGFMILFFGMSSNDALAFVWSFSGIIVMGFGFALLQASRTTEKKPPPPTVTEIRCNSCDFKEIRDFKKGDYILMPVVEACPKCQSAMTIEGVYVVREEPEVKYNV